MSVPESFSFTARHRDQMWPLIYSLQAYWADRTDYYVSDSNTFIHYDPQNRRCLRGPAFFLVLDVEKRERKSWVVWQEGMRFPDVIIELLSDTTRVVDKGEKKTLYERVFHTGEYYLYDPFSQEFTGYHLHGAHYEEVVPDEQRRIYSPAAGLYLAVHDEWLRWMTLEGELVPTPQELVDQERQRADQEQQRADQEQQRAEQERQRADQERQRAEQERQRADQAQQQLEAYQRRFGELD